MKLANLLSPDCTICAAPGNSKKNILEQISVLAANKISTSSAKELLNDLIDREKLSSTGIGKGIAIPHSKIDNTEQPVAVLITTDKAVNFDAIDNKPVDIFFALFVPEDSCQQHLETLASVAKYFSDKDNSKNVRRCTSANQLYRLVANG
ncbi:PTS IIA-like nitrogen regulatory protein PtsN [Thalassotalea sp. Y01]|uniref:PTS IIA-like nitrogen regulatory protein PtsN n=1 Tax=Thalassotalea sp. Y01 TaxID=2729613 RepID=UPI00145E0282|nr:PTS IIA-like nitrogen regulatory protein PtsN [Thalassotalea sp. Y01]NMP15720.1 PTS IIA-like nitrogen regulatory protein PtsN [Thalassotalea sp. Y01]